MMHSAYLTNRPKLFAKPKQHCPCSEPAGPSNLLLLRVCEPKSMPNRNPVRHLLASLHSKHPVSLGSCFHLE